jgi:uncharacterized protein YjiS (DUF1127 family)
MCVSATAGWLMSGLPRFMTETPDGVSPLNGLPFPADNRTSRLEQTSYDDVARARHSVWRKPMSAITLAARAEVTSGRATRPGLLRRLFAHIVRARTISMQRRLLNQLPDHMLRDIGLCRSDIDYVARALADGHDDPTRQLKLRHG